MLGKRLVHEAPDGTRWAGRIVETEAYAGPLDRASHARSGQKGRAAIMWGPAGVAYVYLIYGVHCCFNAVTGPDGDASAVLVRAVELQEAAAGRSGSGPGLVCRGLHIDRTCSGLDLTDSALTIEDEPELLDSEVLMGPRVGVDYAGEWAHRCWRYWVASSKAVSRVRYGTGRPYGLGCASRTEDLGVQGSVTQPHCGATTT
jgi:DNA-3-methyladenine glycosylase